jgi:DNA ligase-1
MIPIPFGAVRLNTLYTANKNGSVNYWTIEIQGHQTRTIYGKVGGKETVSEWYDSIAKNEGRSNEKTSSEQALFEAKTVWQKKLEKGAYQSESEAREVVEGIRNGDVRRKENCMLAAKWIDIKAKAIKKFGSTDSLFPCFCQPKLDGMRAIITMTPDGKMMAHSRNNKPWLTVPHILEALRPMFTARPGLVLDGELYNHEMHDDFDEIASIIKRTKPSVDDLEKSRKMVSFYCYDMCDPSRGFAERSKYLSDAFAKFISPKNPGDCVYPVILVDTYNAFTECTLDELYGRFLDEGYEGQMVRYDTPYEFDRSKNLLKRKEFIDDEFQVVTILEGEGNKKGQAAKGFLRLPDGSTSRFNIKGKAEWRKKLLENKDALVGKWATCQFFNWTPKGGLRFPYLFSTPDAPYLRIRAGKGRDN